MKQFPIHPNDRHLLKSFPWWIIERHEDQAIENHDQTLERLASRGGLSLIELLAIFQGKSQYDIKYQLMEPEQAFAIIQKLKP